MPIRGLQRGLSWQVSLAFLSTVGGAEAEEGDGKGEEMEGGKEGRREGQRFPFARWPLRAAQRASFLRRASTERTWLSLCSYHLWMMSLPRWADRETLDLTDLLPPSPFVSLLTSTLLFSLLLNQLLLHPPRRQELREDPLHLPSDPMLWSWNRCRYRVHNRPHLLKHRTSLHVDGKEA